MSDKEDHLQEAIDGLKRRIDFALGQHWDSHIEWENNARQALRWLESHEKRAILEKAKVIPLNCVTRLDLDAERVIEAAKGQLKGVVIVGYDQEDEEYFASSYADGGTVLWLVERMKIKLLADE